MRNHQVSICVLALSLLVSIGCDSSSPTGPAVSLPATVQLQVGQSVLVSSGNLVVGFVEVAQDSRCPSSPDIQCAWEGEAVVKVDLNASGRVLGSPLLSTHLNNGSSPNVINIESYSLQVLGLDPYPVTSGSIAQSDYRLRLRIENI